MKKVYVNEDWCLGCHLCEFNCSFANSGETLTSIDAATHEVILAKYIKVPFDKLLISTGSRPFIPPMTGLDTVKKQFNFRTYNDAL